MTKPTRLKMTLENEESYVRVISGIVPGGLTKKEMMIVILLLKLQKQLGTKEITQEMKEKVRLHLEVSSQTMHNYWTRLKNKKVILGKYNNARFNPMFDHNVELVISYAE